MHKFIPSLIVTLSLLQRFESKRRRFSEPLPKVTYAENREERSLHSFRLLSFHLSLDVANDDVVLAAIRDANNKYRAAMQKHLDERGPRSGGSSRIRFIREEEARNHQTGESKRSQCLHGTPGIGTCCEPAREPSSCYFLAGVGTQIFDCNSFTNRSRNYDRRRIQIRNLHVDLIGLSVF